MFSWEKATNGVLNAVGLKSIKVKILLFALLATLIPSLSMGWLSYRNNRRAIDEKTTQELTSMTAHAAREIALWLRERRYELKILSGSYEVSENLATLGRSREAGRHRDAALGRLQEYLGSVSRKFADYRELFATDAEGRPLVSSAGPSGGAAPDPGWLRGAVAGGAVSVSAARDAAAEGGSIFIVEALRAADGAVLGALGARVSLGDIEEILAAAAADPSQEVYLLTPRGEILASSRPIGGPFMAARLDAATTAGLFGPEARTLEFHSVRGADVVGVLGTIPDLEWGVVAEKDRAAAYAAIVRLRNLTLALIATVLLGIGLAAYLLGLTIVRPLGRLTQGAAKVAGGDLDVDLPILGSGEVSYLTTVFNGMVARLRRFRDENEAINKELRERNEELQTLSITDPLTGLHNRMHLSEVLAREVARSRRHGNPFSVLMVDIDHFKRYNDTHGHQEGDALLKQVADILRASVRSCDLAARYGGEEFLILLTESGPEGARTFAEKLRASIEEVRAPGWTPVTASLGVASFPEHGDAIEAVIREADEALYEAKRRGRNRVVVARGARDGGERAKVSSG